MCVQNTHGLKTVCLDLCLFNAANATRGSLMLLRLLLVLGYLIFPLLRERLTCSVPRWLSMSS